MFGAMGYIYTHAPFQVISLDNLKDIQVFSISHYAAWCHSYDHLHITQILISQERSKIWKNEFLQMKFWHWSEKIGLGRATAAILEWPSEEYSDVTEKKMRTLTFSTYSWRTEYVDWILIKWQSFPLLFYDATEISKYGRLWSLQYGRHWLQFSNNRCSIQSYFSDQWFPSI